MLLLFSRGLPGCRTKTVNLARRCGSSTGRNPLLIPFPPEMRIFLLIISNNLLSCTQNDRIVTHSTESHPLGEVSTVDRPLCAVHGQQRASFVFLQKIIVYSRYYDTYPQN